MATKLKTIGTALPLTLDQVKNHLKVEHNQDDDLIQMMLDAAVDYICKKCDNLAIRGDTYEETFDDWPLSNTLYLSVSPLVSVTSVVYTNENDSTSTIASTNYFVDTYSRPGRIEFKESFSFPALGESATKIKVTYTVGYTDFVDMPKFVKMVILFLCSSWYENREAVLVGTISKPIEFAVDSMISLLSRPRIY